MARIDYTPPTDVISPSAQTALDTKAQQKRPTTAMESATAHVGKAVTINNLATEQTIASFDLVAGVWSAGDVAELIIPFELLTNSGSAPTLTIKVKIGTTTVLIANGVTITNQAARRAGRLRVLMVLTDTATQVFSAEFLDAGVSNGLANTGSFNMYGGGTAAESLSTTKAYAVTVQFGTANTLHEFVANTSVLLRWPHG